MKKNKAVVHEERQNAASQYTDGSFCGAGAHFSSGRIQAIQRKEELLAEEGEDDEI